jgi:hypothetical protein
MDRAPPDFQWFGAWPLWVVLVVFGGFIALGVLEEAKKVAILQRHGR